MRARRMARRKLDARLVRSLLVRLGGRAWVHVHYISCTTTFSRSCKSHFKGMPKRCITTICISQISRSALSTRDNTGSRFAHPPVHARRLSWQGPWGQRRSRGDHDRVRQRPGAYHDPPGRSGLRAFALRTPLGGKWDGARPGAVAPRRCGPELELATADAAYTSQILLRGGAAP